MADSIFMIALQKETDEMKEKVDVGNRFKAEMAQGISILSQKLGVAASGRTGEQSSMSLPSTPKQLLLTDMLSQRLQED